MHPNIKLVHKALSQQRKDDPRFLLTDEDYNHIMTECGSSYTAAKDEIETVLRHINQPPVFIPAVCHVSWVVQRIILGGITIEGSVPYPLTISGVFGVINNHPYVSAHVERGEDTIRVSETHIHTACGKYKYIKLHKFLATYTALAEVDIRDICNVVKGVGVLKFAHTQEEILHVYLNGPESCMSKPVDFFDWRGDTHPVEAYANGSIAIAYLEDKNGDILARTVCVPGTKTYVQVYGHPVLNDLLYEAEYTEDSFALYEQTLLTLYNSSGIRLIPYIDGSLNYCDITDIVTPDGEEVDYRTGTLIPSKSGSCYSCGCNCDEDDVHDLDGDYYCELCAEVHVCTECSTYHDLLEDTQACCVRLPF